MAIDKRQDFQDMVRLLRNEGFILESTIRSIHKKSTPKHQQLLILR